MFVDYKMQIHLQVLQGSRIMYVSQVWCFFLLVYCGKINANQSLHAASLWPQVSEKLKIVFL